MGDKGHLGVGADADIAVYPVNPKLIDPSNDYEKLVKAFGNASYVLKEGQIIVSEGRIVRSTQGRTFWVNSKVPIDLESSMLRELETKFTEYYTVKMENYKIPEKYLGRSAPVQTVM